MLWLKCVILNQRFSNFGLVEFANFDFISEELISEAPLHPKILKMKGGLTSFCVNPLEKFSDFEKVREGASLRGGPH